MSVACSSEMYVQSAVPGARYLTLVSRIGLLTRFSEAAPFGQRRPREIGESGSPSIWTTFSSLTYTFCPQPTAQYGHTDWTTLSAVFVRGASCSERTDCAARPRPNGSPPSCRRKGASRRRELAIAC